MNIEEILKDSELYKTSKDDNIEYTDDLNYIESLEINEINDLYKVFDLLRYWGVKTIPWKIFDFLYKNKYDGDGDDYENKNYKRYKPLFKKFNDFSLLTQLKAIIFYTGQKYDEKLMSKICKFGYLNMLKWYYKKIIIVKLQKYSSSYFWEPQYIRFAVNNGHLECVKFLSEHGCPRDHSCIDQAIAKNQLECLKYLVDNEFPILMHYVKKNSDSHHSNPLHKYLYNNDCITIDEFRTKYRKYKNVDLTYELGIKKKDMKIIRIVHINNDSFSTDLLTNCINNSFYDGLAYFNKFFKKEIEKNIIWVFYNGIENENIDLIKFIIANNYKLDKYDVDLSDCYLDIKIKNYRFYNNLIAVFKENKIEFDYGLYIFIIENGTDTGKSIKLLEKMNEVLPINNTNIPNLDYLFKTIVRTNNLKILQYFMDKIYYKHIDILKYCLEYNSDIKILKYLSNNGLELDYGCITLFNKKMNALNDCHCIRKVKYNYKYLKLVKNTLNDDRLNNPSNNLL